MHFLYVWVACVLYLRRKPASVCSVGRAGGVFAWMACWCGWRQWPANVGDILLLLFLLLLKYYPEGQNVECLLLQKKWKNVPNRFEQWFKTKPDLKSRCLFTLFGPVMQGSWISLNLLKHVPMWQIFLDKCNQELTSWMYLNMR